MPRRRAGHRHIYSLEPVRGGPSDTSKLGEPIRAQTAHFLFFLFGFTIILVALGVTIGSGSGHGEPVGSRNVETAWARSTLRLEMVIGTWLRMAGYRSH